MGDWKATRVGLNSVIKSMAGRPARSEAQQAWGMNSNAFWHYQAAAFRRIYHFARARVPYYRERADAYPPMPQDDEDVLAFLETLPVLKKDTVRQLNEDFWPQPRLPLTTFHTTSGTTGTPLRLAATLWEKGRAQAIYEEWMLRLCGERNPRTLGLSGFVTPANNNDLVWRDRLLGHGYLSIYSLNEANRSKIIDLVRAHNPCVIYGYTSAIYELARLVGMSLKAAKDERIVVTTCEVLYPDWRAAMEESLCRQVFDMYGSQEGSHLVPQCPEGGMHINPLIGILEILDDQGRPCSAGESGQVVVTGLNRRSMPLVRYELGDMARSTGYATDCPCGLKWPTIGPVEGRSEDLVLTRDGRRIGYLAFHATRKLQDLRECQLVQTGYEQFVCNLVLDEGADVDTNHMESEIRGEIEHRLQLPVEIEFRYLPNIPRGGAEGKFRAVMVDFEEGRV